MSKAEPSLLLLPFAYPDYPRDRVQTHIERSERALRDMGLRVAASLAVVVPDDVPAALAALKTWDYDLIVATLISWVEAPLFVATLRSFFGKPLLLWSHTTFEEGDTRWTMGALPAAGVLRETLEEMRVPFRFVYGMPEEPHLVEQVRIYARAAATARALAVARIGLFGYASMGMYSGTVDHTQLRAQVGPEIEHLDQYLIVKRFEQITDSDARGMLSRRQGWDVGAAVTEADLLKSLRMYAAIGSLAREHKLDALTIKCQYELSREFGLAPCLPLSLLGDEVVSSCEGDLPLVASQLMLHYLTGEPTSYGDLHHVEGNSIIWGACGFTPLSYAAGCPVINKHTALYEGLLNSSPYKTGPVTLARLAAKGGGFKLHIATGEAVPPPAFRELGCPAYAITRVVMDGDVDHFMQHLGSQHYAIAYGHVAEELRALCDLLGLEAVLS